MKKRMLATLGAALCSLLLAAAAQAATDPLFIFTPAPPPPPAPPLPPPTGFLNGPCGLGVDSSGRYYVADYYHHAVDFFNGQNYQGQLASEDPTDGPCGLALNSSNQVYVNNYHRNIVKFNALPSLGAGTVFPLPSEDTEHHLPTGVAVNTETNRVYVDHRSYVSVYDASGVPVEEGGEPLEIGKGSLGDGYGVAVSQYSGTPGYVYVPDAVSNTVKVYNPPVSKTTPVAELKDPFSHPFVSLRDSAIAVDKASGTVYFADNLQPEHTEKPQATIYAYTPANVYAGHLKYNVIDALPVGLAVDNSAQSTKGRVYVTSGNANAASVYAYAPGSATFAAPLPPLGSGLQAPGSGSGVDSGPASEAPSAMSAAFARGKGAPEASASVIAQADNLRVSVEGKLSPKKLPRKGAAPVSVTVGWDIATVDGSPPPKLKQIRIEINKEGHFQTEGLPACPVAKIQPASTQRALSNCRSALVGRGTFEASIALKGQEGESYPARGQLLLFNGEAKGKPVLYGQIYSAHPFATSFLIVFSLKQIEKGDYGTELLAKLPASLRSWGDLTGIQMRLHRNYRYEGKSRSYVSAGCPAPKGFGLASFKLARTSLAFDGGKRVTTTVTGECKVRG